MADTTVIGLTLVKINGIYHLDVKNSRSSTKRATPQNVTGAGVKTATGQEMISGSFDEVIPRDRRLDWRSLRNFSIEIFDKETKSVVIVSADGCNWGSIDDSSDLNTAVTGRAVAWVGNEVLST